MPEEPGSADEDLLREAGCKKKVVAHCRAVRDCALDYAGRNPDCNFSLVSRGAMLHDIGRSKTHTISHAQAGADMIREMGLPEELARIVECHTGAGLTADEATMLGLFARDCIPQTTEEKIVTHADNLIAGSTRVTIDETLADAIHLPKKARKRMERLAREVEMLCAGPHKR